VIFVFVIMSKAQCAGVRVCWVGGLIKGAQAAISLALEKGNCKDADLSMKVNVVYLTSPQTRLRSVECYKRKWSELLQVQNPEPLAEVHLNN
jgi:hypothetical protein